MRVLRRFRFAFTCFATATIGVAQPSFNDTVRFLEQSTFGATPQLVSQVQATGFDAFLQEQFAAPASSYPDLPLQPTTVPASCNAVCRRDNYTMYPLQVRFFQNALQGTDQLRQRVVFALHQILVVSGVEVTQPSWMVPYLKLLEQNAFGNFRQLLTDITLNPAMGNYLDMAGNRRTNPNENYARELLQLFSLGLDLLQIDGTPVLDSSGKRIPTYTEATVGAFARVFTGWNFDTAPATGVPNYTSPMVATAANHDTAAKTILNGVTLPANRTAAQDLTDALDNVFQHQNVGPFIGKQLIQHLVTSNPSPAYVGRVAAAFNNNGAGVRGDMKAVIRAILLDPEARSVWVPFQLGHLREPVLFITTLLRHFSTTASTTDFVLADSYLPTELRMGQDLFRSPSVFNYFPPAFTLIDEQVLGPEFAIYSTSTAMARANFVRDVVYKRMATATDRPTGTWLDLAPLQSLAATPAGLVDELNKRMMHGQLSLGTRASLVNALSSMPASNLLARVQRAVYLIATSAEYTVQR